MTASHNIPDFITETLYYIITDKNNKITFVSERFAELLEYSQEELYGKDPRILKYPTKHLSQGIMTSLELNNRWNGILKDKTKNGEPVYFNANIYKDYDKDGHHIGYHSIHTDITYTIETPHDFIFENEFINLMFSHTDDYALVCLCESETIHKQIILEISSKMTKMLGVKREKIIDHDTSFTDIVSPNSIYYQNLDSLIYDYREDPDKVIIEFIDTHGLTRKFKLNVVEFYFQGNNLSRLFTLTDITKELEYSTQLESVLKSKNDFLANVSHDIKTPLSATNGFLSLLKMGETSKDKLDYISIIEDNTKHLLDLTNDVIDFARMDNNKLTITQHNFTPRDIQSTIEIFVAKSLEKNIHFNAYMSPQLPEIMSQDIVRIKQIITNLISNALKFVNDGGTINFDCSYFNGKLQIIVGDDGIGMSDAQISKIFDPYTQATRQISLMYGGSGLGLTVVKQLIDLMGGTIKINSGIDKGSKFIVTLPVKIIKENRIEGKIVIDTILILDNKFTYDDIEILKRNLVHFTTGNIKVVETLDDSYEDCLIFIKASDLKEDKSLQELSIKNKLIIIKNLNDVLHDINDENIVELNLPILGSKLFNALNSLILKEDVLFESTQNPLDLEIKGKILVADDLKSNRLLIKELFSRYDIDLVLVSDGEKAVNKFTKSIKHFVSDFDLIILDMNMPVLDGAGTAKKIRDFERRLGIKRTPIIALSANRYEQGSKRLIDMDEYIEKPINFKHLLSTIIKYSSNQDIEIKNEKSEKIQKLREIKNILMRNPNNHGLNVNDYKSYFKTNEIILLTQMINFSKDKTKLTKLYNSLMKLIRKSS